MRVILFFDQIQAGHGGKERGDTPLGLEKGGVGSYLMFKDYFQAAQLQVVATVYCGPEYFQQQPQEVVEKISRLIEKTKAEVLFCGPCFNYGDYIKMALQVAKAINISALACRAYVVCSTDQPELLDLFKEDVPILDMPKKGGTGLTDALRESAYLVSHPTEASARYYDGISFNS